MKAPPLPQVVSVSPNPFFKEFSIHLQAIVSEQVIITIYDKEGNAIITITRIVSPGNNDIAIEMDKHCPGTYFLKCHTHNNSFLVVIRIEKR